MSRYKILVVVGIVYTIAIIIFVINSNGFYGLRFLIFYAFVVAWFFVWWMRWLFINEDNPNEIKKIRKGQLFLCIYFVFFLPLAFGMGQKISIIFFDIDQYAEELKETKAVMNGSNVGSLNRFSSGALATIMISKDDEFPVSCNLLVKDNCLYDVMHHEEFYLKYKNKIGYPFKNFYLIFEIKSDQFYRGVDYHVNLYKNNQKYALLYVFFVVFASFLIMLIIPRALITKNHEMRI